MVGERLKEELQGCRKDRGGVMGKDELEARKGGGVGGEKGGGGPELPQLKGKALGKKPGNQLGGVDKGGKKKRKGSNVKNKKGGNPHQKKHIQAGDSLHQEKSERTTRNLGFFGPPRGPGEKKKKKTGINQGV